MNDDIKEILGKLEIVARKHTIEVCDDGSKIETMPASIVDELRLNNWSAKLLLDYITNLQEELEEEKRINQEDLKLIDKLEERLEKALEYMKDFIFEPLFVQEDRKLIMYNQNLRKFENILNGKGSDE